MYYENNVIKNAQNTQKQFYNLLKENNFQDNKPENIIKNIIRRRNWIKKSNKFCNKNLSR